MELVDEKGKKCIMDASTSMGAKDRGMTPMQLLAGALVGCMSIDVLMRIVGSVLVIAAYFVILHVNIATGVLINVIADSISIPYFIRTKSWDVVIMIAFLLTISVSKFL